MDKNKFYTFADSTWSGKYGYIAINRDDNQIYDDIFAEQKSDDYPSNEYMPTTEENIKQMSDLIEQRELLKNKFQTHDLAQKGMYEQAARVQEPTIRRRRRRRRIFIFKNRSYIQKSQG